MKLKSVLLQLILVLVAYLSELALSSNSGDATFYTEWSSGLGSCGYPVASIGKLIVALPQSYMPASCGKCIKATGSKGSVVVKVTDTCPGCPGNNIDLSDVAFEQIEDKAKGRVPISWDFVSCDGSPSSSIASPADVSGTSALQAVKRKPSAPAQQRASPPSTGNSSILYNGSNSSNSTASSDTGRIASHAVAMMSFEYFLLGMLALLAYLHVIY